MPARLIIESDVDNTNQEVSFDRPRITIGRKPGNDLHFNRPEISGSHAAFLFENDNYYVTDLGSTNGTLLNGAPIVAKEKYPLTSQDVVTINPYRIRFEGEIGATMMEAVSPDIANLRRSGTITKFRSAHRNGGTRKRRACTSTCKSSTSAAATRARGRGTCTA